MRTTSNKVKVKQRPQAPSTREIELESDLFLQQYDFKPVEYIQSEPYLINGVTKAIQKGFKKTIHFIQFELSLLEFTLRIVISKPIIERTIRLANHSKIILFLSCFLLLSIFLIMTGENTLFLFFWFSIALLVRATIMVELIFCEISEHLLNSNSSPENSADP